MEEFEKTTYSAILGIAGTGKSTILREAAEKSKGDYILCSTTGISAVNLGAGITLNSLLWFFNEASLLDSFTTGKLDYRLGEVYGKLGVRRILCDEVSMLPATNLSIICFALENLNNTLKAKNKPPMGFTVSGDYLQLPPVKGDFAFESEQWEKFEENTTILTQVHRQTDKEFVQALQKVREGNGKEVVDYFKENLNQLVDPKFNGTMLYPYNSSVDRQNQYRLEKVDGKEVSFESKRSGKQRGEWKYIPDRLELKIGALVMILANNYKGSELEYCNGDLGEIVETTKSTVKVKLQRNSAVVEIEYITRNNEEVVRDKKTVVGSILYLPVRLAYSTSIHKSQSLTLDRVQVDIRPKFYKECPGMLYTALSRCRSKEGLRLIGSPRTFVQNCTVNPKVRRFL